MRIKDLFEDDNSHVTFCFGRMNPPTIGHKLVFETMARVGGEYKIFLSPSQDKKDNPLDYETKIRFVKDMFPEYADNVVNESKLNTPVKVASYIYELGYRNATFVAGSDRLPSMSKLLKDYNGVEGKAHGYYKFDLLDFESSGEREDGAPGITGVSASDARMAAANDNFELFKEKTGAGTLAQPLFDAVKKGLGK